MRITEARSSARRVAIFAAHTGHDHTDPHVVRPPNAAEREPFGFVITPSVVPDSLVVEEPQVRMRRRLVNFRSDRRRSHREARAAWA